MTMLILTIALVLLLPWQADAFAANNAEAADGSPFTLFDRFRATCPADVDCIRQFDPSLIEQEPKDETIWVAVHRSSNNMPSVLVKDEFLHAMRSATGAINVPDDNGVTSNISNKDSDNDLETTTTTSSPLQKPTAPVAVARLRPSDDWDQTWVMDNLRCVLKKETMDETCDGGSEHNEAIAVAIDALLQHHLKNACGSSSSDDNEEEDAKRRVFEGAIRTKATLFSARLLEDRGFVPVSDLQKDMASHISSLDACLEKYAERSVSTLAKSPGSRQRALDMVSLLGRLDRTLELQQQQAIADDGDSCDGGPEEIDPWSGVTRFF